MTQNKTIPGHKLGKVTTDCKFKDSTNCDKQRFIWLRQAHQRWMWMWPTLTDMWTSCEGEERFSPSQCQRPDRSSWQRCWFWSLSPFLQEETENMNLYNSFIRSTSFILWRKMQRRFWFLQHYWNHENKADQMENQSMERNTKINILVVSVCTS